MGEWIMPALARRSMSARNQASRVSTQGLLSKELPIALGAAIVISSIRARGLITIGLLL